MLSPDRLQRLRDELLAQRESLQRGVDGLNVDELSTDEEIGVGNHMADDATEVFNQEANLSLLRNQQHALDDVERALQRMERGEYGVCERCGREIDFARLKASPAARFCLEDQRLVESES
jgi:RNA polymerase-binding protein DksA